MHITPGLGGIARRADFGLAAYSFPFTCGLALRDGESRPSEPLGAYELVALALKWRLTRVEMPLNTLLPSTSDADLDQFRENLERSSLSLTVDSGVIDEQTLGVLLPLAARVGARVVRAMPSTVLEGARAALHGGWAAHMAELCRRLERLRPSLEAHDLILAIENHQDASSDDLLTLCEAGGERVGITLDVANPLAVGEDPLAFARKVAPWVRNVHLKDYQVYHTESGYRLVRCALGEGMVPLHDLISLLRELAPEASHHIELAALQARHIRLFEPSWWNGYPPCDVRELLPVLRLVARHARPPGEDWRTPWERREAAEEVIRYELEQFERSVDYLYDASSGLPKPTAPEQS